MRTSITWRAISAWPNNLKSTRHRESSPFRTTWSDALTELDRELSMLNARNVVIELDVIERDIRKDGQPKADARVRTPGVILSFERHRTVKAPDGINYITREERFVYPADKYNDWQDNVLAIARVLNALRLIDRYGVTPNGEQYAGFKQLPGGNGSTPTPTLSVMEAVNVIAHYTGHTSPPARIQADMAVARAAIRVARNRAHPDAGGSDYAFRNVQSAADVLAKHHGIASW